MIMISKCQRRLNRTPKRNNSEAKLRAQTKSKYGSAEVEEVFPPRSKRQQTKAKPMINRCCYATPDYRSFGQLINECNYPDPIKHDNLVGEQYKSIFPDFPTIVQLQELTKFLCDANKTRVESASQYTKLDVATENGDVWQNVDNTAEIEKYLMQGKDEETLTQYHNLPKNFYISEAPRVKKIAEKFTKYKKNNIEVRKIEEKIVCVEYDVFNADEHQPVQKMRVFFAIKPVIHEKEDVLSVLPPSIENHINITSAELQKLSQKEVEIIDGKIIENQPYLEDLRKILHRRQCNTNKVKTTLNLKNLYEMAKREFLESDADYDTNVLSKEGLIEVQNLILGSCSSSSYGINRTTVKNSSKVASDTSKEGYVFEDTISRSLVKELLKVEVPQ